MSDTCIRTLCLKCGEGLITLPSADALVAEAKQGGTNWDPQQSAAFRQYQQNLHGLCCPKCNNPARNPEEKECTWLPIGQREAGQLLAGKTVHQVWASVCRRNKVDSIVSNIITLPINILRELLRGRIGGELTIYGPLAEPPASSPGPDLGELREVSTEIQS